MSVLAVVRHILARSGEEAAVSELWLQNYHDGKYPDACIVDAHLRPKETVYNRTQLEMYRQLVSDKRKL